MIRKFTGRMILGAVISLLSICVLRPSFALENAACVQASSTWHLLTGSAQILPTGKERILQVGTFAFLSNFDDFSTFNENLLTFVQPGTRFFVYDNQYQQVRGRKLVLLENGICTYLTDNDVSKNSGDREQYRKAIGMNMAAFLWAVPRAVSPACEVPAGIGPGEALGVVTQEGEYLTIRLTKADLVDRLTKEGRGREALLVNRDCDFQIPSDLARVIDLTETIEWKDKKAFHAARFSSIRGLWKHCNRKYESTDDIKVRVNEKVGAAIKASVIELSASEEAEYIGNRKYVLSLADKIDYQEEIFQDLDGRTFYFATQTECEPTGILGQGEITYRIDGFGPPVFWSLANVRKALKDWQTDITRDEDKSLIARLKNNVTGRPIVTCPEQYFGNLQLLQRLGLSNATYGPFILSRVGLWLGRYQSSGFVCR